MKLRGYLALGIVCLGLVVSDLVQRLIIWPLITLMPSRRTRVLSGWLQFLAALVLNPFRTVGGASIPRPDRIVPSRAGVLVVMNHQSLLDIPLVVQTVDQGYPRIVTRARYRRFVPLISHLVRLYQYPTVDPTANAAVLRETLDEIGRAGRESDVPIAVFPEGTRTRSGKIGRFKRGGLSRLLSERPWTVYVYVVDGFWKYATFKDLVLRMGRVEGRMEHVDTLEWTDPTADSTDFVQNMRTQMIEHLESMRGSGAQV